MLDAAQLLLHAAELLLHAAEFLLQAHDAAGDHVEEVLDLALLIAVQG
ncbi:MAG: hypothetical protein ACREM2_11260 [Vulcanimicrobiaceae bacterium]